MKFSVIIPTCNRNDLLSKCIDLLSPNSQIFNENYEVIVTDDSKGNIARELVLENYQFVKWVEGPKKGPAANRNNGSKIASGEWLVFIDDDCLPDKNLLSNYSEGIIQYPVSLAFEGSILPDDWKLLKRDMAECPVNTDGNCFWSANICIQKQLFKDIGGFDEAFLIAAQEDQDLYNRLKKITSVIFLKKCVVVHPVRFVSLLNKLGLVKRSIENWYLFAKRDKSFFLCFIDGLKSQIKALLINIKAGKIKTVIYHIYIIIVFLPLMIKLKIIKNES